MNGNLINPYAIYVRCDGGMDYDSKNTAGVGIFITFPDFVGIKEIRRPIGRYEKANIERVELEALIKGLLEIERILKIDRDKIKNVAQIIVTTDRDSLIKKLDPFTIREWKKRGGKNNENKTVKNWDLIYEFNQKRNRICKNYYKRIDLRYSKSKYNKVAHGLAKIGKNKRLKANDISIKGIEIGKRIYDGEEVDYNNLTKGKEYCVSVFLKQSVRSQWEIVAEICEGNLLGQKVLIRTSPDVKKRIHRTNKYKTYKYIVKIRNIFRHHVTIYKSIIEVKHDK